MLFKNIHIAGKEGPHQILVEGENIISVTGNDEKNNATTIGFDDAIAFPGLINSHDHLEFNLFPQLADRIYNNYTEWAEDIQLKHEGVISAIQKIPKALRAQWGIYKNLLNGFTTVVDHGDKTVVNTDLVTIFQRCKSLHSVQYEKKWKWHLTNPLAASTTFVIHIGEGTDEMAHKEIDDLIKNNFFKRRIVGVHGVAMDQRQAEHFTALVWCPETNYNLLGKTASVDVLKKRTTILFGTDSTLTANWNAWQQLRKARDTKMLTEDELLNALTVNAAKTWGLKNIGAIEPNMQADMVIARNRNIFELQPEGILLVMRKGDIKLFDEELKTQFVTAGIDLTAFSSVLLNNSRKYVKGDLPGLMNAIRSYHQGIEFPIQPGN